MPFSPEFNKLDPVQPRKKETWDKENTRFNRIINYIQPDAANKLTEAKIQGAKKIFNDIMNNPWALSEEERTEFIIEKINEHLEKTDAPGSETIKIEKPAEENRSQEPKKSSLANLME